MEQESIKAAVTMFEEEIARLGKQVEEYRRRTELCVSGCDPIKKAASLGRIQHDLDVCSRGLERITEALSSLQEKRQELQVFCSDTVAMLEKKLREPPSAGAEEFSPSSISPLA